MDIFSHGLWAGAAARGANKLQSKSRISVWAAALWGIFPDLFAFAIPFVWMIGGLTFGDLHLADIKGHHGPMSEPVAQNTAWMFSLSSALYNVSHSLIIFLIIFLAVWLMMRRPLWELGGWFLHILSDVPTHSYQFFPTPIFWPLFDWKFDGFSWGTPWFLIPNYILLLIVYLVVLRRRTAHTRKLASGT